MIRLGSLAGYSFEGPRILGGWTPPARPAVFAIMYKAEAENKPDRYSVIYVGQSDNLAESGLPFKHPRSNCWIARAGTRWKLHICTYEVAGWARSHRETIVQELAATYNPYCNEQKYDNAWKDEWIGSYKSDLTGPLAQRGADGTRANAVGGPATPGANAVGGSTPGETST
ncbi:MAG: hypothetical protein WCB57_18435 [Pseudonocardiaceae bacterium]